MRQKLGMTEHVVGWDVGGAHLKAVLLDGHGEVLDAIQLACPLWRGLSYLEQAVQTILHTWATYHFESAVTMTGELVDLFSDRAQGVCEIALCMQALLGKASVHFYVVDVLDQTKAHFVADVSARPLAAASMNWHASATFLAGQVKDAVVVDIGSTTTDIVPVHCGQAKVNGITDAERMQHHQLLYTGVVRTPLMAFGPYLNVNGKQYHLAAEYFATTADVYRLLGELTANHDLADTADGQDKSLIATARRLARMIGRDLDPVDASNPSAITSADLDDLKALALGFKQQQMRWIAEAIQHNDTSAPLIGLGAGQFLIEAVAKDLARPYMPVQTFIVAKTPALADSAALCFPAFAVAKLRQLWH